MPDFTIRVELHGATGDDYDKLHSAMQKRGFVRTIEIAKRASPGAKAPRARADQSPSRLRSEQRPYRKGWACLPLGMAVVAIMNIIVISACY